MSSHPAVAVAVAVARHSGLGHTGRRTADAGEAVCELLPCSTKWNAFDASVSSEGGVMTCTGTVEKAPINCVRAPGPAETAHRYLLPPHCAHVAAGKNPTRSKC